MLRLLIIIILISTPALACEISTEKETYKINEKITYNHKCITPLTYWITQDNQIIKQKKESKNLDPKTYTPKNPGQIILHLSSSSCQTQKTLTITGQKPIQTTTKTNIKKGEVFISSSEKAAKYAKYGLLIALFILLVKNGIHNKKHYRNHGLPRRTYNESSKQHCGKTRQKYQTRDYQDRYRSCRESKRKDVLNICRTRNKIQRY